MLHTKFGVLISTGFRTGPYKSMKKRAQGLVQYLFIVRPINVGLVNMLSQVTYACTFVVNMLSPADEQVGVGGVGG